MPRKIRTAKPKAMDVLIASDVMGMTNQAIARNLGVPRKTVVDIVNGNHGWDELRDSPAYKARLAKEQEVLAAGWNEITKQALCQIEKKLAGATAASAAYIAGVGTDKVRILRDQPTEIVSHHYSIKELAARDNLIQLLGQSLIKQQPVTIDVTPVPESK